MTETMSPPSGQQLEHHGQGGELFAINLVNLLLKGATLGIYHFWAKTRVRRYVWSQTGFAGERLEYTGRGGELLRGYLIAMVVLGPLAAGWQFLINFLINLPILLAGVTLVGYLGLLFFSGLALFSSRRYLLSRTRWRGIRFGMSGSAIDHGRLMVLNTLFAFITLGMGTVKARNRLRAHIAGNIWFGSQRLVYEGEDWALLKRFLALYGIFVGIMIGALAMSLLMGFLNGFFLLGSILRPLSGIIPMLILLPGLYTAWMWYRAGEYRYIAEHSTLGPMRFRTTFTNGQYMRLMWGNLLLIWLTGGMGFAWVVVRTARFLTGHLELQGELDLDAVAQSTQEMPGSGEGLAEALDLGSI